MTQLRFDKAARPKGRKRIMRRFELDEISVVDNPAQAGATVKILKFGSPPLHALPVNYPRVLADVKRLRKAGHHKRADKLANALAAHAQAIIIKRAENGENVMKTLFDGVKVSKAAPASASAGSLSFEGLTKEERAEAEEMLAAMEDEEAEKADDMDGEYTVDMDGEAEKADEEEDPDETEEAEELQEETLKAMSDTDMDNEREFFSDDTEVGAEANKAMRDSRISKRRALLMGMGRVAANRGSYQTVAFAKAKGRTSTDAHDPFHQQRGAERRTQMDDRATAARAAEQAEIDAMRGAFGREREERKRAIDTMVQKLRAVSPRMPHTQALRKIRAEYPGLFG